MNPLVTLLAGAAGGSLTALIGGLVFRKKTKAETADLITIAAERVMAQALRRSDRLEREVAALWRAVHRLADLARTHGGDPAGIMEELDQARAAATNPNPDHQQG